VALAQQLVDEAPHTTTLEVASLEAKNRDPHDTTNLSAGLRKSALGRISVA
jgi:hypothetical protein